MSGKMCILKMARTSFSQLPSYLPINSPEEPNFLSFILVLPPLGRVVEI